MLILTQQQEDIIEYTTDGDGNLMVVARAGTGKTKTAALAAAAYHLKFPDNTILGMAFNKDISVVLGEAIPSGIIKTANAFGLGGWIARNGKRPMLNKKKTLDIIKEMNVKDKFPDLARAVAICKAWGLVPKNTPAEPIIFMEDTPENHKFLFDSYNIDTEDCPDPIGLVREALMRSIMRGWKGEIDFDDQLYLSTIYKAPFPKADLFVVDEAQDLNPIQRYMARQMLKPGGRLLALGDDAQAIYGFRGADRDSIDNIVQEFDCTTLPLTVSFRCPKAVVQRAQVFVPDIETFDGAKEGKVTLEPPKDYSLVRILENAKGADVTLDQLTGRLAILCRNNAPLIGAALRLISHDIGAIILGREIEKGLCSMIDKQKANTLQELNSKLFNFIEKQKQLLIDRNATSQAELLEDKAKCFEILISNEVRVNGDVDSLKKRIKTLFSDKVGDAPVLLSTIHKAKGLEWPNVFILESRLMPSRFAKTPKELQQENNLHYVAITRSKNQLVYIDKEEI